MLIFKGGSAGKESACKVGDLGSIPGLERSPEKEKATHSSILAWRTEAHTEAQGSKITFVKAHREYTIMSGKLQVFP